MSDRSGPARLAVHIDRLVLEGVDLNRDDRDQLDTGVREALGRSLTGGLDLVLLAGEFSSLVAPAVPLGVRDDPRRLGQSIGHAVGLALRDPSGARPDGSRT
jgi:hypothetical protein